MVQEPKDVQGTPCASQPQEYLVVAIDGPAGSGKSTAARLLAKRLGGRLLDTGAIYRCLALKAKRQGLSLEDGPSLATAVQEMSLRFEVSSASCDQTVKLDGEDVTLQIRTPEISSAASLVATHPEVRRALLSVQRSLASNGLVVAEGRDMGTVVFPDAMVKLFLKADPEVRAKRRLMELRAKGHDETIDNVMRQQEERDRRDAQREAAPLRQAPDAHLVDSSDLTPEEMVQLMADVVTRVMEQKRISLPHRGCGGGPG